MDGIRVFVVLCSSIRSSTVIFRTCKLFFHTWVTVRSDGIKRGSLFSFQAPSLPSLHRTAAARPSVPSPPCSTPGPADGALSRRCGGCPSAGAAARGGWVTLGARGAAAARPLSPPEGARRRGGGQRVRAAPRGHQPRRRAAPEGAAGLPGASPRKGAPSGLASP